MIEKYFKKVEAESAKKHKVSSKQTSVKGKKKKIAQSSSDFSPSRIKELLAHCLPRKLTIDAVRIIDSSGYSPEGVDLAVYEEAYPDIISIMNGYVPSELVCAVFHLVRNLDRETLYEAMGRAASAKKLDFFTGDPAETEEKIPIPSFIVCGSTKYHLKDLKRDVVERYLSKNIEPRFEFDILMVMKKGLVIKNWREKRSFIALETGEDTLMWFFVLMNEYLDIDKKRSVDFRNYIKKQVVYDEY